MTLEPRRKLSASASFLSFVLSLLNVGLVFAGVGICGVAAFLFFASETPSGLGMAAGGVLEALGLLGISCLLTGFAGMFAVAEESPVLCGFYIVLLALLSIASILAGFFFVAMRTNSTIRLQSGWLACSETGKRSVELMLQCCGFDKIDTSNCAVKTPVSACEAALNNAQRLIYSGLIVVPFGMVVVYCAGALLARYMARQYRKLSASRKSVSDASAAKTDEQPRKKAELPESFKNCPPPTSMRKS